MALNTLTPAEARQLAGKELGVTEWKEVTQELIDLFARATGDQQWIHTDPERAARESPFRTTIAHGYFTLALVPAFFYELLEVRDCRMLINFGANEVRWPAPVPIPSRVRLRARIPEVENTSRSFTLHVDATIEVEGQAKPAMTARVLFRYYV
ncbi:MAG: MaoC family dehydratase [Myxococcales bacterium]|jgi:acyl dehydratase